MKLWYLEVKSEDVGYDEVDTFVIRAETEKDARLIAYGRAGDEGDETWRNPEYSTCEELTMEGEEGIILRSFNAG